MNVVNDLFFELLQVAIGNRQSLSRVPTPEEWEEIYEMSKKQSLAGIAFAGVERLPQEQMPPGKRIRQWAVKAEKIREHNVKVSEDCRVISRFFEENGFDCVILKGQGNFAYYPEWLQGLRSAGDIDVWVLPKGNANDTQSEIATIREHGSLRYGASAYENGLREAPEHRLERKNVNGNGKTTDGSDGHGYNKDNKDNKDNIELARSAFEPASATSDLNHPVRSVIEFCLSKKRGEYVYYHNLDFPVLKATPVEVHYRPTWLYNPFRNRVLQRWFRQFTVHNSRLASVAPAVRPITQFTVYDGYKIPSVEFNVVFQLLHLYKHIFEEGIGLRQLLDYYFVITKYGDFVRKRNATLRNAIKDCYENDIKDNIDNRDNEMQSEIATIREHGSLRYGASAYDNVELLNPLNPSTIELITKLGLKEFAGAVMYVMREVFAMPEERMLCRPDEKRGKKLLEEIMIGGNFGKFDERYNWAETTSGSMDYRGASYAFARLRHNFQFLKDYPSEVLWEPVFRVYHWVWRKFQLWRWE